MAVRMGIRDLRDNLTKTIRRVRDGETIEVTHQGIPVAVISPVARNRIDRLIEAGLVRPARLPLDLSAIDPLPVTGSMSASEALEEDRAGR